jgi:hypothetical protein
MLAQSEESWRREKIFRNLPRAVLQEVGESILHSP